MNAREAARRQQAITDGLFGLKQILTNKSILAELNPDEERLLKDLIILGVHKLGIEPADL